MIACPDQLLRLHGLLDGELDAANTVACEHHLKSCEPCRAEYARLTALGEAITGQEEVAWRAPPRLRQTVEALIDEAETQRSRPPSRLLTPWAGGAGLGAIAASLAILLVAPALTTPPVETEVVASHVRSLLASHLTDVATSNQHLVKPWFNGRIEFAPPTPDLADEGFPLAGGRVDYIGGKVTPAIVYRRRLHVINLFVWPSGQPSVPEPVARRRDGYSLLEWRRGGLEFWAVSDIAPADLRRFQAAFSARAQAEELSGNTPR